MFLCPAMVLSLTTFASVALPVLLARASPTIKQLVTFGDSYTDQSRLDFFNQNNSFPPKDYQPVFSTPIITQNGGAPWVRYAEIYGNISNFNYAVAGAACSNLLTGRPGLGPTVYPHADFPSVREYEIQAFVQDHITNITDGNHTTFQNDLNADETVYSIWIGTNDVGFGSLLTGNQTKGVTIVDVAQCVIDWMTEMYTFGARNFIIQNMVPLQHTPVYSDIDPAAPNKFFPFAHNATQYSIEMQELVAAGNKLWSLQVPATLSKLPNAKAAIFDSHSLVDDIWHHPEQFLNGTLPLNVTGFITGDPSVHISTPEADSFLWYDQLHPSEQTRRIVAREMVKTFNGTGSKYGLFFGDSF